MHAALEKLYALPAAERGPDTAVTLVDPAWERLIAPNPSWPRHRPGAAGRAAEGSQGAAVGLLPAGGPAAFRPAELRTTRRGRTRRRHAAAWVRRPHRRRADRRAARRRLQDRQGAPEARALAEFKAMFQMKFYAVALLRSRGVLPARLRLLYLADGQVLDYSPDLDELLRFEKTLMAIWRAIQSAGATGDFRPHPSRLCDWCAHHAHCPVFGGTPPPYPGWPRAPTRVTTTPSCTTGRPSEPAA